MDSTLAARPSHAGRATGRLRTGLILAIVLGIANIPFLFMPAPDGEEGPPLGVLILGAALGVLSVVTAAIALRNGNRAAIRVTAACVILNAVSSLPAFFVDVSAGIKLAVAVTVLASVACIVLLFSRPTTN